MRLASRFGGLFLLVAVLPTFLMVSLILFGGRPVILQESRLKPDGTRILTYVFRTTGEGGAVFHAMGRFLRHYGLGEFPALWNVVRGELVLRDLMLRKTG